METDVQRFVETLISKYGLLKVVLAPYSLVPLLAALGLFRDRAAAIFAGTCMLFLASFVVIVALSRQLAVERGTSADRQEIINTYAELIVANRAAPFRYEVWQEYTTVGRGGDTMVEQYLTLRVTRRAPVHVVWVALYQSAGPPLSVAQQQKVKVTANRFELVGYGRRLGADYKSTRLWEDNKRLRILIHFSEPLQHDQLVYIHLRWTWPGFYQELVRGGRDVLEWINVKIHTANIESSLTFQPDCRLHRGLEIVPHPGTPAPRYHVSREGTVRIDLEYRDIPATQRKVGLGLDASRNRSA